MGGQELQTTQTLHFYRIPNDMHPLNYTQYAWMIPQTLYKLLARSYIDYKFPRHIYIETTTRCNLQCPSCPRPDVEEDMRMETFLKIIDECKKYGPRSFSLHGFGEPTMDPLLHFEMLHIKARNKKNNVILTTNGVKITTEAYDLADKIIITYKAPYNLDRYKPWKHKIMIRNFTDVPVPGSWKCETKEYHNFGGNVKSSMKTKKRYPCYHLWLSPMIAWNGDVLLCCNDPKHIKVLGNIKDKSIAEIWQGDELKRLRYLQMAGVSSDNCIGCNVWSTYPRIF